MKSHFERHRRKKCLQAASVYNNRTAKTTKMKKANALESKKKNLFIFFLLIFSRSREGDWMRNEAYCVNEEWTLFFSNITSFQWPLKKVFYYNNQMLNKKQTLFSQLHHWLAAKHIQSNNSSLLQKKPLHSW